MTVSQATKLRWFDQGARAFAQSFPSALDHLGRNLPPLYVCPLCIEPADPARGFKFQLFAEEAVISRVLTAEHVPPKCFGGRELLLTCGPCNHTAGARLDAEARKRENPLDALIGRAKKPVAVHLTAGGHRLPAKLWTDGGTHFLKIPQGFKPGSEEAFKNALRGAAGEDRTIHMNFYADRHSEKHARTSWLRAAYLVLFAVMGYRYIFGRGLALVRQQIREPEAEPISTFLCRIPDDRPWSERRIIDVREPTWQRCWAVQMGRYLAFLPRSGDASLYDRLADARKRGEDQATVRGTTYEWPRYPSFGID